MKEKQLKEQQKREKEEKKKREEEERLLKEQQEKEALLQQQMEQEQKEREESNLEPEDRGPEVPMNIIKDSLDAMHNVFVTNFDDTEHKLVAKIKELEIKIKDKPITTKPPPKGRRSKKK